MPSLVPGWQRAELPPLLGGGGEKGERARLSVRPLFDRGESEVEVRAEDVGRFFAARRGGHGAAHHAPRDKRGGRRGTLDSSPPPPTDRRAPPAGGGGRITLPVVVSAEREDRLSSGKETQSSRRARSEPKG